jgi:hypothetical protein
MKTPIKATLKKMERAIEKASNECHKLPCGCDSYIGFICPIHGWRRTLENLSYQIRRAIEAEE